MWTLSEDKIERESPSSHPIISTFAFGVLGIWDKFKGDGGEKKMEFIKKILKK